MHLETIVLKVWWGRGTSRCTGRSSISRQRERHRTPRHCNCSFHFRNEL